MTSVTIRGMTKSYGAVRAVDSLDLDIDEGELVVLLGPSGCGKTTTLRCIAGLEDISEGRIFMGDDVVSSPTASVPPEKRSIGMVFQSYAVWPHMTVAQNVAFGLRLKHIPKATIEERVGNVLELVGLGNYGSRNVSQLSGGQQQRVALARAIVLEPRVLLFDEPLSNLDAKLRERMRFELRSLQKRLGITSVYVTHDQQEAMVIADRVVLMNGGRIEQMGSPGDLYHRPVSRFAAEFIGLANVLPGQVIGVAPTRVRLDSGAVLQSDDDRFAVGDRVELICRPEHIVLSPTPIDGPNTFTGNVSGVYFLGNLAEIFIDTGGMTVRCQSSPPQAFEEGNEMWGQFPPERVVLLRTERQPALQE